MQHLLPKVATEVDGNLDSMCRSWVTVSYERRIELGNNVVRGCRIDLVTG